jgi:spore coat polysaccharide biosynthesis protein SpsF
MLHFQTDQEKFWADKFGDEYTDRNQGAKLLASNISFFSKILSKTQDMKSVIELGANLGLNLHAIKYLIPEASLSAVEINKHACEQLGLIEKINVYNQSILDFSSEIKYDLVLIKGVLIHINPEKLSQAYNLIYNICNKYICIAEYYNPMPVAITYRGHENRLFKRDFAGEMLDRFKDLVLIDYGFAYHRDNNFVQDDLTWFLIEKKK